jgi:endonuclease YncB( thermonuclease family)
MARNNYGQRRKISRRNVRRIKSGLRLIVPLAMLGILFVYQGNEQVFADLVSGRVAESSVGSIVGRPIVTDGDTLKINGQRIRMHGIDAPESRQTCEVGSIEWNCGQRATEALRDKIGGDEVRCAGSDYDRYDRLIAVCKTNGEDLNAWMVEEGWALAYRRYSKAYVSEEQGAENRRLGIWQGDLMPPWEWRKSRR